MALRDKLVQNLQPVLQPGERVHYVFPAQTGPNPNWIFLSYFVMFAAKQHVVAVTDRGIVRARTSMWSQTKIKSDLQSVARYPYQPFGEQKGWLFSKLELNGEKHYVHRRFRSDVESAHNHMAQAATMPPPPSPMV